MTDRKGKKSVLLLTQAFPPETNAGANRVYSMARVLSRQYDLSVVSTKPSYPSPESFKDIDLEPFDGQYHFSLTRTLEFSPHKGSLLIRGLREQIMAFRVAARGLRRSPDIIIASSPSMFLGPVALLLARAKRAKFVWEIRDVTWSYAKEKAGSFSVMRLFNLVLEKYMLYVLRRADLVIGATDGITDILIESGLALERAVTIRNGISSDLLDAIRKTSGRLGKGRPKVTYAGAIGYNQELGVIMEVAAKLPEVDFILAGDGPERSLLEASKEKLGLENVFFKGYLSRERLFETYSESTILFAQVKSTPVLDSTAIPSKLFEFMATGKPILYAGKGSAARLLRDIGCAVVVPPGNSEAISKAIVEMIGDKEKIQSLGDKGKAFVETNYNREKLMEQILPVLRHRFG